MTSITIISSLENLKSLSDKFIQVNADALNALILNVLPKLNETNIKVTHNRSIRPREKTTEIDGLLEGIIGRSKAFGEKHLIDLKNGKIYCMLQCLLEYINLTKCKFEVYVFFTPYYSIRKFVLKYDQFDIEIYLSDNFLTINATNDKYYYRFIDVERIIFNNKRNHFVYFNKLITIINNILLNNDMEGIYLSDCYSVKKSKSKSIYKPTKKYWYMSTKILDYRILKDTNDDDIKEKYIEIFETKIGKVCEEGIFKYCNQYLLKLQGKCPLNYEWNMKCDQETVQFMLEMNNDGLKSIIKTIYISIKELYVRDSLNKISRFHNLNELIDNLENTINL